VSVTPKLSYRRVRAVLGLIGETEKSLARACRCSNVHLHACLIGDRKPSGELAQAVSARFGRHWNYCIGETDVLAEDVDTEGSGR
jgi:hypothetical protein